MVYRIFVEKKAGLDNEAKGLLNEAKNLLGIESLQDIRLFNRYDAENISEELFDYAIKTVFSEPQLDDIKVFVKYLEDAGYDRTPRSDSGLSCDSEEIRKISKMAFFENFIEKS